jgi:hypothetical protein
MSEGERHREQFGEIAYATGIIFVILLLIIILVFRPSIDYSSTIPNATGEPTQIAAQTVPTLVNGITTVAGITIAFGGVLVALSFEEVTKDNPKARRQYFSSLPLFLLPLGYLCGSYILLALGFLGVAIKYAFSGLLVAVFVSVWIYLYTARRLNIS